VLGPVQIVPGVFGLGSEQVNFYVVEERGRLTVVDAGLPGFAETFDRDLAQLRLGADQIDAVVLTHSDGDHTGIASELQRRGLRVLIHEADEATLAKPGPKGGDASVPKLLLSFRHRAVRKLVRHMLQHGGRTQPKVEGAETFAADDVLDVPGALRVVHTPGHTPGHCALVAERHGVVFTGDALMNHELFTKGRGPRLMPSFFNQSTAQARASLDALEPLEGVLLFGHGEPWHDGARAAVASARG
jgi:glyoxylase-like metal-dependent hydrolase (beta-lactamase superfamily II)